MDKLPDGKMENGAFGEFDHPNPAILQYRRKECNRFSLIIDAMDLLYTDNVDGFCIVSSDSDFTRLASRLRESGKEVIGMGEDKTPKSFRAACTVFTNLEVLLDQEEDGTGGGAIGKEVIEQDITSILLENEDKNKATGLGEIGNRLVKKNTLILM